MKKLLIIVLSLILSMSLVLVNVGCKEEAVEEVKESEEAAVVEEEVEAVEEEIVEEEVEAAEPVTIKFTSWRTEDIDGMEVFHKAFMEEYPNIIIEFQPIKNTEYMAQLSTAIESETLDADIIALYPFGWGRPIYDGGALAELTADSIPELGNLSQSSLKPWTTEDGIIYGAPLYGNGHGVFYNKGIFDKYGLDEPKTWDEFTAVCDTLKENGETVIAQGSKDAWTIAFMVFSNIGANFFGGEESRLKVIDGEMKFTDEQFIKAFEAIDELTQYYPEGYQSIDYVSMQQMFTTEQAAMFIGGSWEISTFKNMGMEFELGWFPAPVENEGDVLDYYWASALAMGLYVNSPNAEEVITYFNWVLTPEAAEIFVNEFPGMVTYVPAVSNDPVGQEVIEMTEGSNLVETIFMEELSNQEPSAMMLLIEAMANLANGDFTPLEAAEHMQTGLETWYEFK